MECLEKAAHHAYSLVESCSTTNMVRRLGSAACSTDRPPPLLGLLAQASCPLSLWTLFAPLMAFRLPHIMKESWKYGIHRFQSDVPRTMIRIGYGVASEDGVQWSHAEHKKAKASRSGSTTKKRKATKSFGDIGSAPNTRTSARLHTHEQHAGDAHALEPAPVEAGASPPRMAPVRREGPRLRREHQAGDEDDNQDDVQVVGLTA